MLRLSFAFLLALTSLSCAADFRAPVLDDDDKPICLSAKGEICIKELTLGLAVRQAFDAQVNQQGLSPEEKDRRGELSQGLIGANNPHLLDSDLKTIKTVIGNAYPPSIVHRLWKMLEEK